VFVAVCYCLVFVVVCWLLFVCLAVCLFGCYFVFYFRFAEFAASRCTCNKKNIEHEKEYITVALHGTDYPVATMIAQTGTGIRVEEGFYCCREKCSRFDFFFFLLFVFFSPLFPFFVLVGYSHNDSRRSFAGFANISSLDEGYFGRGIYFSTNLLYCFPYFNSMTSFLLGIGFGSELFLDLDFFIRNRQYLFTTNYYYYLFHFVYLSSSEA
jgi:hypothetical protein